MSNINREVDYSTISTALGLIFDLWARNHLHTAAPGIIDAYDAGTKRARIQPALDLVTTDGERMAKAPWIDVPVVWPAAGGYTIISRVRAGDACLVIFSERGLGVFKRAYEQSEPTVDRFFSESDGVALLGFGGRTISPASESALCMQTEDGSEYIAIEDNDINVHTTGTFHVRASTIRLQGDTDTMVIP